MAKKKNWLCEKGFKNLNDHLVEWKWAIFKTLDVFKKVVILNKHGHFETISHTQEM